MLAIHFVDEDKHLDFMIAIHDEKGFLWFGGTYIDLFRLCNYDCLCDYDCNTGSEKFEICGQGANWHITDRNFNTQKKSGKLPRYELYSFMRLVERILNGKG